MPRGTSQSPGWFRLVHAHHQRGHQRFRGNFSVLGQRDRARHRPCSPHRESSASLCAPYPAPPQDFTRQDPARSDGSRLSWPLHLPRGVKPVANKVVAPTKMPMPKEIKQLRSLLVELSYNCKYLPQMLKIIRPIQALINNCQDGEVPLFRPLDYGRDGENRPRTPG